MASSVAALRHLGRERRFGGPLALSKVHWVRPSLNGMQNAVGPEGFDGLFEGEAAMEAEPFSGVAMPLNIEAVGADPVEAGEGRIELLAEIVREAGAVALDEAIFCAVPSAENVDGIVELSRLDRRQETRLEKVVDQSLTGGGDAGLLGFGECGVRLSGLRMAHV